MQKTHKTELTPLSPTLTVEEFPVPLRSFLQKILCPLTRFDQEAFAALHHMQGRMSTCYGFSKGVQQFRDDGNNHRVHQKLLYVLLSCPDGTPPKGMTFETLAEEAFRLIPPIS